MAPTTLTLAPRERMTFDGPVQRFEVVKGEVQVLNPDGTPSGRPRKAPTTIHARSRAGLTILGKSAATVRIITEDDAQLAARLEVEQAERDAIAKRQGRTPKPSTRPPMRPPVR